MSEIITIPFTPELQYVDGKPVAPRGFSNNVALEILQDFDIHTVAEITRLTNGGKSTIVTRRRCRSQIRRFAQFVRSHGQFLIGYYSPDGYHELEAIKLFRPGDQRQVPLLEALETRLEGRRQITETDLAEINDRLKASKSPDETELARGESISPAPDHSNNNNYGGKISDEH